MENKTPNIVPSQKKGSSTGAKAVLEASSRTEAIKLFEQAKARMLNINNWQDLCGKGSAEFKLTDKDGNLIDPPNPQIGNLIRIKLPAPSNDSGDGYDWVRIEAFQKEKNILKDEEIYGFRVRPVQNPVGTSMESAHFYTSDASSTFILKRQGHILSASEEGRNEIPNANPFSFLNKIRNMVIAVFAMLGFANPQWKKLVNGILQINK